MKYVSQSTSRYGGVIPRTDVHTDKWTEAYGELAERLLCVGTHVRNNTELMNVRITVNDPFHPMAALKRRSPQRRYFAGEFCYYLNGTRDLATMEHYSKRWRTGGSQRLTSYSPGATIFGEGGWESIIKTLASSKDSRQAYLPLFGDSSDSGFPPCATGFQVMIRDNHLVMMTHMRSQDFWLGMPYDVGFFMLLQQLICRRLEDYWTGLEVGHYIHSVGSLHVYDQHKEQIKRLVADREETDRFYLPRVTREDAKDLCYQLRLYESLLRIRVQIGSTSYEDPLLSYAQSQVKYYSTPLQKMLSEWLTSDPQGGIYARKKK